MIVICTNCQAKFRVADEKIGPRGAKVRCSRCRTVFLVRHDTLDALDALHDTRDAAPPLESPSKPSAIAAGANLALESQAQPPPMDDPFGSVAASEPPGPSFEIGGADPFAPAQATRSALPVTDLSDLIDTKPPPPPEPPPLPPPLPSRAAEAQRALEGDGLPDLGASPLPGVAPGQLSALEVASPFDAAPMPNGSSGDPLEPAASAPAAPSVTSLLPPDPDDQGLALEDRVTPRPRKVARIPREELALELGEGPRFQEDPPFEMAPVRREDLFAAPGEHSFDDAPAVNDAHASIAAAPGRVAQEPSWHAASVASAAPKPFAPSGRSSPAGERLPGRDTSRLRAVAVNAVSLAALILVALAILALWRTEGRIEPGSLRPSALLGALRGAAGTPGPFGAREVRSGMYEREHGAPLLFVSGKVVSHAPVKVAGIRIAVQVVRGDVVLAHGETVAGAVPTPEELYAASDEAALSRAAAAALRRAPASIKPGEAVPFLVAIGDAPPDLEGAALKLDIDAVAPRSR